MWFWFINKDSSFSKKISLHEAQDTYNLHLEEIVVLIMHFVNLQFSCEYVVEYNIWQMPYLHLGNNYL